MPPRAPGKEAFAGCQVMGHPAKKFKKKLKKFFAGCLTAWHPAKADGRWPPSSRPPLPAAIFCRVAGTRQRPIFADGWNLPSARLPAKVDLPEAFLCRVSPGLAPGKEFLCRVPDKKHPANIFAPGKSAVSCSGGGWSGALPFPPSPGRAFGWFAHVTCAA